MIDGRTGLDDTVSFGVGTMLRRMAGGGGFWTKFLLFRNVRIGFDIDRDRHVERRTIMTGTYGFWTRVLFGIWLRVGRDRYVDRRTALTGSEHNS